jgi:hypothetical protein
MRASRSCRAVRFVYVGRAESFVGGQRDGGLGRSEWRIARFSDAGLWIRTAAAVRFQRIGGDTQLDAAGNFWNVRGSDVFDPAVGHGWNAAVSEFQRGTAGISEPLLAALYRDGHWQSAPRTFQVGVDPTKTYDVRIHTGDRSFARDQLQDHGRRYRRGTAGGDGRQPVPGDHRLEPTRPRATASWTSRSPTWAATRTG